MSYASELVKKYLQLNGKTNEYIYLTYVNRTYICEWYIYLSPPKNLAVARIVHISN